MQESGAPDFGATLTFNSGTATGSMVSNHVSVYEKWAGHPDSHHYMNRYDIKGSTASPVYKEGLSEVRPTNIAQNYIIKY